MEGEGVTDPPNFSPIEKTCISEPKIDVFNRRKRGLQVKLMANRYLINETCNNHSFMEKSGKGESKFAEFSNPFE